MASELTQDRLTGSWNFMPVHSSASFAVKYLVASFRGRFEEVKAELINGRLEGAVKVASVSVKDENLRTHLQSPDFFRRFECLSGRHRSGSSMVMPPQQR